MSVGNIGCGRAVYRGMHDGGYGEEWLEKAAVYDNLLAGKIPKEEDPMLQATLKTQTRCARYQAWADGEREHIQTVVKKNRTSRIHTRVSGRSCVCSAAWA